MSNIVVHQPPSFTIDDMWKLSQAIAKGGLFGSNDPNAVLTLCMVAQAEGKHPGLVLQQFHVIQGKPAKKADAMLQDFLAAGGSVEWHALTDDIADATFSHPQGGSMRISWDNARVQTAGLGSNPMHKKYPRAMKRSRVVSEGVRTVFPGATSGMYVPEEVEAFDDPKPVRQARRVQPEAQVLEHQSEVEPVEPGYTLDQARMDVESAATLDELTSVWRKRQMSPWREELAALKDERKAALEADDAFVGEG